MPALCPSWGMAAKIDILVTSSILCSHGYPSGVVRDDYSAQLRSRKTGNGRSSRIRA